MIDVVIINHNKLFVICRVEIITEGYYCDDLYLTKHRISENIRGLRTGQPCGSKHFYDACASDTVILRYCNLINTPCEIKTFHMDVRSRNK